jgi:voltage-gated potassium channel
LERGPDYCVAILSEPDEPTGYSTSALQRWRARTDGPLLVIAIGSLPLLLLEFDRPTLVRSDRMFLDAVNVIVLAAFAIDYVVELALVRRRALYVRKEWTSLVIVVSQALALLPGLAGFGVLRALRGARAVRAIAVIFRLVAIGGAAAKEGRHLLVKRAARFALSMAALTWLASAAAFMLAENTDTNGHPYSFADALWWSISTITTVGYGDIFPVTPVGRLIAGMTMVVGISTFAVVTAKVAEFLVRADQEAKEAE